MYYRQTEDFFSVLTGRGVPAEHFIATGLNHYSIIDQHMRPDTALSLAIRRQMGLERRFAQSFGKGKIC